MERCRAIRHAEGEPRLTGGSEVFFEAIQERAVRRNPTAAHRFDDILLFIAAQVGNRHGDERGRLRRRRRGPGTGEFQMADGFSRRMVVEVVAERLVETPCREVAPVDFQPNARGTTLSRTIVEMLHHLTRESLTSVCRSHCQPEARHVEALVPASEHPIGHDIVAPHRKPVFVLARFTSGRDAAGCRGVEGVRMEELGVAVGVE